MSKLTISAVLLFAACVSFAASAEEDYGPGVEIVEFRIAPGTGDRSWNSLEEPIRVRVGQVLRFINEDSIPHRLHTTNGAPCPHGKREFAPGESYDCVVEQPHDAAAGDMYDHNAGPEAQVYVQAD